MPGSLTPGKVQTVACLVLLGNTAGIEEKIEMWRIQVPKTAFTLGCPSPWPNFTQMSSSLASASWGQTDVPSLAFEPASMADSHFRDIFSRKRTCLAGTVVSNLKSFEGKSRMVRCSVVRPWPSVPGCAQHCVFSNFQDCLLLLKMLQS